MRYALVIGIIALVAIGLLAGCSKQAPVSAPPTDTGTQVNPQPATPSVDTQVATEVDSSMIDDTSDVQIGEMVQ